MARIKKYDRTAFNDISYKGPLHYRHLLLLGWLCIALKVFTPLTALGLKLDPSQPQWLQFLNKLSVTVGPLALSFFLLANFAILLDKKKTYKTQLIKFGALSVLVIVVFIMVSKTVFVTAVAELLETNEYASQLVEMLLNSLAIEGTLIFNLFIDMFMCTLFMFFLEYVPQKYFQGKKLRIFRAMAVIPVAYEVAALILRISMVFGNVQLPLYVFPFLTTKPFMSFILFVILALHIKVEDYRFRKRGKSHEEFEAFLKTNDHSLRFSIFTSVMILITGLIDALFYVFGTVIVAYIKGGFNWDADIPEEILEYAGKLVEAWRIGSHWPMIVLIPIVLLFSYTRNPKHPKLDILVPVFGMILVVALAILGIAMNLPAIEKYLESLLQMLEEGMNYIQQQAPAVVSAVASITPAP